MSENKENKEINELKEVIRRQHEVLLKLKKEREVMENEIKNLKEEKREWLVEKEELKGDVKWRDEAMSVREELTLVATELENCQKQNIILRRENDTLKSAGEEALQIKKEKEEMKKKVTDYESRILSLVKIVEQCKIKVNNQTDQTMKLHVQLDEEKMKVNEWNKKCIDACKKAQIEVSPENVIDKLVELMDRVNKMKIQVEDYKFRYNRAIERMTDFERNEGNLSKDSNENLNNESGFIE